MVTGGVGTVISTRLRRRRAALAGVVLLTAVVVGTGLAATATARRAASSLTRALEDAAVADIGIDVSDDQHLAEVAALPEVDAASTLAFVAVRPAGSDLIGGIDVVGVAPLDVISNRTMDRPRVLDGRLPRVDAANEVTVSAGFARARQIRVGDALPIEAYAQDQVEALFGGGDPVTPAGDTIDAVVVGIAESLDALTSGNDADFGVITFSPAMWRAHGPSGVDFTDEVVSPVGVFRLVLRAALHDGERDADGFLADLAPIYGDGVDTTFSEARPEVFQAAHDSVKVTAIALALFALATSVTGLVIATQAVGREVAVNVAADDSALRGMGVERRSRALGAATPVALASVAGVALGVLAAVAVSGWVPSGLVRDLEPDRGVRLDGTVLLSGGAATAIALASASLAVAWRATSRRRARRLAAPAANLRGAPPVTLGLQLAIGSGGGERVPARPTLVAAIAAVAGVVAAVVFGASLDHAVDEAQLWGAGWDSEVLLQAGGAAIADREQPRLAADDEIAGLTRFRVFEATFADDDSPVTGGAFRSLVGSVSPGLLHGRSPKGAREVAVDVGALPGPAHRIGDKVTIAAGGPALGVRVVGILTGTGPAAFVVTDALADALEVGPSDEGFLIRWTPTTDREAAEARLRERFAEVDRPQKPGEVRNLERVRSYPGTLAVFFAVLGVGSVAHLCVTAARRRRRDLAVAKALGFTRRQVRAVLAWQATVVTVIGLVAGIPLGVAAGRATWSAVTRAMRMLDEPVIAPWTLVAIALGAVAAVNAAALVPGWLAAHRSPARELHRE